MSKLQILIVVFLVCSFLAVTIAQSDGLAAMFLMMQNNRNQPYGTRRSPLSGLMQWLMLENLDYI
ncbi:hypothetical protein KP79_PYT19051 [Mizuhopecten yessoensis]|uniref:Uncharacterized protein n=1 Tax=Mizuhopecten yessoensis TaxID=6573 RepID=A0A210PVM8_MIZYE|nr:hypothetical protein KP79_PYT19051 [Mizuhopecten yessoensis]